MLNMAAYYAAFSLRAAAQTVISILGIEAFCYSIHRAEPELRGWIGRAANEAARIESQCRELDEPLLVSGEFARLLPGEWRSLGRFELRNIDEPVESNAMSDRSPDAVVFGAVISRSPATGMARPGPVSQALGRGALGHPPSHHRASASRRASRCDEDVIPGCY